MKNNYPTEIEREEEPLADALNRLSEERRRGQRAILRWEIMILVFRALIFICVGFLLGLSLK